MIKGQPSAMAEWAAMIRALHERLDERPLIFDDPLAARLVGPETQRHLSNPGAEHRAEGMLMIRSMMMIRSRVAEDALYESVAAGVRQYVILGAGLDSFAYRQPAGLAGVTIYELDHPDTQQWKRRRLAEAGLPEPGNLRFVAVDFTRQCLQERLVAAGLRCAEPAFFSWVGVTYYLSRQAFLDTLRFIGTQPGPSGVVFDFALRDAVLPRRLEQMNAEVFSFMEDAGEPWRLKLTPKNLTSELRSLGFREIRYLSPAAANEQYLHKRRDGLRTGPLVGLMHAIV